MRNINEICLTEIIRFLKNQPIEILPKEIKVEIEKLISTSERLVFPERISRIALSDYDKFQMLCFSILLLWDYIPHGNIDFAFKRQNGNNISTKRLNDCVNNRSELVAGFISDYHQEYPQTPINKQAYESKVRGVKYIEDKICDSCPFFSRKEEYHDYYWHLQHNSRYAEYFKDSDEYKTYFSCLNGLDLSVDGSCSFCDIGNINNCPRHDTEEFNELFYKPYKYARKKYHKDRQMPKLFVNRFESKWDDFFYKMSDELFEYINYFVVSYYKKLKILDIAKNATSRLLLEEYLEFDKPFKKLYIKYAKL